LKMLHLPAHMEIIKRRAGKRLTIEKSSNVVIRHDDWSSHEGIPEKFTSQIRN
jgi:hypothetical protein